MTSLMGSRNPSSEGVGRGGGSRGWDWNIAVKMDIMKWFIIEHKCVLRSVYETGRKLSKPLPDVDP